jgi:hypothetical protein
MAAIIRHFRGSGRAVCLSGIAGKRARSAQLPHLRPSFAENKFNRPEKISKIRRLTRFLAINAE